MKSCPACRKQVQDDLTLCPFCRVIFSKWEGCRLAQQAMAEAEAQAAAHAQSQARAQAFSGSSEPPPTVKELFLKYPIFHTIRKSLLGIVITAASGCVIIGSYFLWPRHMSIEEYYQALKGDGTPTENVVIEANVKAEGKFILRINKGSETMDQIVIEDGTGTLLVYFESGLPDRQPKVGDRVKIRGRPKMVLGMWRGRRFILSSLKFI